MCTQKIIEIIEIIENDLTDVTVYKYNSGIIARLRTLSWTSELRIGVVELRMGSKVTPTDFLDVAELL